MINKKNEIARCLLEKETQVHILKEENNIIVNENKDLKNTILRMLHQIKLFEEAETNREKDLNVNLKLNLEYCFSAFRGE
jgi:hypothetical protein